MTTKCLNPGGWRRGEYCHLRHNGELLDIEEYTQNTTHPYTMRWWPGGLYSYSLSMLASEPALLAVLAAEIGPAD